MNILDNYVKSAPNQQHALDIFRGEWASKLPAHLEALQAGSALLFEDERIEWCAAQLGGFEGKTVLELGPLEAGHTYMLEHFGATIVSIEANTRAYLKCLIIKELLELKRSRFLCGDFVEYLRTNQTKFDVCIASGVLYHMLDPVELIALAAKASDQLFIWTHYYDHAIISNNPNLAYKFSSTGVLSDYAGFQHKIYRQEYKAALDWQGFCGGNEVFSHWLSRDDILACLRYFGFKDIQTNFEHVDHPNGPSFALTAVRSV